MNRLRRLLLALVLGMSTSIMPVFAQETVNEDDVSKTADVIGNDVSQGSVTLNNKDLSDPQNQEGLSQDLADTGSNDSTSIDETLNHSDDTVARMDESSDANQQNQLDEIDLTNQDNDSLEDSNGVKDQTSITDQSADTLSNSDLGDTPVVYSNEQIIDLTKQSGGELELTAEEGSCSGHTITGTFEGDWLPSRYDYVIDVLSGEHTITLQNTTFNFSNLSGNSVINVRSGAALTINLEGINNLNPGASGGAAAHPAIWVEEGSTLTIQGTGTLYAYANGPYLDIFTGAAGIGNNNNGFGTIIINSGTIYAHGVCGGAGIGGGYEGVPDDCNGTVVINGGTVYAYGGHSGNGWNGSGIGAGENADFTGTITINGGLVYAQAGSDELPSIGGGGSIISETSHGKFTTGENGHAVIIAPNGIGDHSEFLEWDGIFLSYGATADDVTYDAATNTYTFDRTPNGDNQYNAEVFGEVKLNSNVVINSNAVINIPGERVGSGGSNIPSASLHVPADKSMVNNGEITVGGDLYLHGDQSKYTGSGRLIESASGADMGRIHVLLTDSMVSAVSGDNLKIFDNSPFGGVVVKTENLWAYWKEYVVDIDYELSGDPNGIEVGTYALNLTVPENSKHLLEPNTTVDYTYEIAPHDITVVMPDTWTLQKDTDYSKGVPQSPNSVEPTPSPSVQGSYDLGNLKSGILSWYLDQALTQPLTDTSTLNEGDTLYWVYSHFDTNFVNEKSGSMIIHLSDEPPVTITIYRENQGVTYRTLEEKYGTVFVLRPEFSMSGSAVNPDLDEYKWEVYGDTNNCVNLVTNADGTAMVTVSNVSADPSAKYEIRLTLEAHNDPDHHDVHGLSTASVYVIPQPKPLDVEVTLLDREYYPGVTSFTEDNVELDGVINSDDVFPQLTINGTYTEVGTYKDVNVMVDLNGTKSHCYEIGTLKVNPVSIRKATTKNISTDIKLTNRKSEHIEQTISRIDTENPDWIYQEDTLTMSLNATINDTRYLSKDSITLTNGMISFDTNAVNEKDPIADLGKIEVTVSGDNFDPFTVTLDLSSLNSTNPLIYVVSVTHNDKGDVTPDGAVFIEVGNSETFTFKPLAGYRVASVTVDGRVIDQSEYAKGEYTFTNVNEDHTLDVQFEVIESANSDDSFDGTVKWDDGGPFTTDECGSVYDRWGNVIYQGVCGIIAGFQLVNTSDN